MLVAMDVQKSGMAKLYGGRGEFCSLRQIGIASASTPIGLFMLNVGFIRDRSWRLGAGQNADGGLRALTGQASPQVSFDRLRPLPNVARRNHNGRNAG